MNKADIGGRMAARLAIIPPRVNRRRQTSVCRAIGIASNIAKDAPVLIKPLVNPLLRHFLQSSEEAVTPAIYLCCAEAAGSATGMYLHPMQRKSVLPAASDPENGARLWEAGARLVAKSPHLH